MIENSASELLPVAEEGDAQSDDPDPSPLTVLVPHAGWHELGDVEAAVRRAAEAVGVSVDGVSGREVAVVLTCDSEVRELNARYRGQDKPTNVLSFEPTPAPVLAGELPPLGDIIIAYETVIREAAEEGKPPLDHLAHLTAHGLLHLAGFDHDTSPDAEAMEALERDILADLGIPDPYSTSPSEKRPSPGRRQPL